MAEKCEVLKKIWLRFLDTPKSSSEERRQLLDLFLNQFTYLKLIGEDPKYVEFGDWSRVGSLLVHYFMRDIHLICQSIQKTEENIRKTDDIVDDNEGLIDTLHHYILKGTGWKFLFVLKSIGLKGITCTKELINVLTSMFPICLQISVDTTSDILYKNDEDISIEELFFLKKSKFPKSHISYRTNPQSQILNRRLQRLKLSHFNGSSKSHSASNSEEEEINSTCIPVEKYNHNTSWSELESSNYTIEQKTSTENNLLEEQIPEFVESVSLVDFCLCMTDILLQIALLEHQNPQPSSITLSQLILNFCIETLKSLDVKQFYVNKWLESDIISLKRKLLRVITVTIVTEIEMKSTACNLELFEYFLKVIKNIFLEIPKKDYSFSIKSKSIILSSEIIMIVLFWILKIIELPRNNESIKIIIHAIRTFSNCDGISLCCTVVSHVESHDHNIVHKIIIIIRDMVISLKKLRFSRVLSSHRSNLRSFELNPDHHHDFLGSSGTHNILNKIPICCVATVCHLLLNLFLIVNSDSVRVAITEALRKCGMCCCLDFHSVLNILLKRLPEYSQNLQISVVNLIEKTVLKQFRLTVFSQNTHCDICSNQTLCINEEKVNLENFKETENSVSLESANDGFLYYYVYLIANNSLSLIIGNSLLNIVSIGHEKLKKKVFCKIVIPAFLSLTENLHENSVRESCIPLEYTLIALSSLLRSHKLTDVFLRKDGLSHLFSLINCCSLQNLALQAIKCLLLSHCDKCDLIKNTSNLQSSASIENALLSFENILFEHTNEVPLQFLSCDLNNSCDQKYSENNEPYRCTVAQSIVHLNEQTLPFLDNLWLTCKELICKITAFKYYMSSRSKISIIHKFLRITLKSIHIYEDHHFVKKLLISLFHSILTVCIDLSSCETSKQSANNSLYTMLENDLTQFFPQNLNDLQAVFEILFQCMEHACPKERIFERLNYDKYEEFQSSSDSSEEIDIADEGYEGDTEMIQNTVYNSLVIQSTAKSFLIRNRHLCKMIINLLTVCKDKNDADNKEWLVIISFVLQKFINLCKSDFENRIIVHQEEVVKTIFISFEDILTSSSEKFREIQEHIMDLFVLIGQYCITKEVLLMFLNCFKSPSVPMVVLLSGLNRLMKSLPRMPSAYITYPTKNCSCKPNIDLNPSYNKEFQGDNNHPLENRQTIVCNNSCLDAELCSWKCSAVFLPLCDDATWHPLQNGFSVSIWLSFGYPFIPEDGKQNISEWNTEESSSDVSSSEETRRSMNVDNIMHVLSVGTEVMFESWLVPNNGDMIFRITKSTSDGSYHCLGETSCPKLIQPQKWQHVVIKYKQTVKKETIIADVAIIINGFKETKFFQVYSHQIDRCQYSCALLGHNRNKFCRSSYNMGNLMLFQDNVLMKEQCYYLSALGPDIRNVTECHLENQAKFFVHHLTPNMLESGIDIGILTCLKTPSLTSLQEKLVATYSPEEPSVFTVYPNVFSTVISLLSSFTGLPASFKVVADDQRPSQQQPINKPVKMCKENVNSVVRLQHSLNAVGGIKSLIFLLGRVVECSNDEESHSIAVEVIFSLLQRSVENYNSFISLNGNKLILSVLKMEKCITSYRMLQVFLNVCLNGSILHIDSSCIPTVDCNSQVIIVNPRLFEEMLSEWQIWEKVDVGVLSTLFSVLQTLVRDKHPYKAYNISQVLSVSAVDILFNMLEDKFLNTDQVFLSPEAATIIPWLIRKLLNNPLKLNLLESVFNCLLLLHQASRTYICHAYSSFYFLFADRTAKRIKFRKRSKHRDNSFDGASGGDHEKFSEHVGYQKDLNIRLQTSRNDELKKAMEIDQSFLSTTKEESVDLLEGNSSYIDENKKIKHETGSIDIKDNLSSSLPPVEKENQDCLDADENILHDIWTEDGNIHIENENYFAIPESTVQPSVVQQNTNTDNSFSVASKMPMSSDSHNTVTDNYKQNEINSETENALNKNSVSSSSISFDEMSEKIEEEWEIISLHDEENDEREQIASNILTGDQLNITKSENIASYTTLKDEVMCRLINILRETIITAPDSVINDVLTIVKPEALIIFAHHPNSIVTSSVIMTLDAYLQRGSYENIDGILKKKKGFHMLANQLHQYPATLEVLDACLTIIVGHPSRLTDDISDFGPPLELNSLQLMACIPLLALLPNTCHDMVLCHNTLARLQQLLDQIPTAHEFLLENGLMESLAKLLSTLSHSRSKYQMNDVGNEDLIHEDIYGIIYIIVTELVSNSGSNNFRILLDILSLFSALESRSYKYCGISCICSGLYQNCQCAVFSAAFEYIILNASDNQKEMYLIDRPKTNTSDTSRFNSILDVLIKPPEMMNPYPHYLWYPDKPSLYSAQSSQSENQLSHILHPNRSNRYNANYFRSKVLSFSETVDRFRQMLIKAVDFLVFRDANYPWLRKQKNFAQGLLHVILQGMTILLERSKGFHKTFWFTFMSSVKETICAQFSRLLTALLTPKQPMDQKLFVIRLLTTEEKYVDVINSLLETSSHNVFHVVILIHDILHDQSNELSVDERREVREFSNKLTKCKLVIPSEYDKKKFIEDKKRLLVEEISQAYKKWLPGKEMSEKRALCRLLPLAKHVSENAMDATRMVVNLQNIERKMFMTKIKCSLRQKLMVENIWYTMIEQLTHERTVWFMKDIYPENWELDPTEGPQRVRRRLKRFHLNVKPHFLLPEYRNNFDLKQVQPPLGYLYETRCQTDDTSALIDKLHTDDKICYNCCCQLITTSVETPGEALIGEKYIHFVAEKCLKQVDDLNLLCQSWLIEDINEILPRRYELQDNALEIFLANGLTYLISFQSNMVREEFLNHIKKCVQFCPISNKTLSSLTNQWREHFITNFEYLTQLNKLAGRSFNDLMQYPVFPFVLANYSCPTLDLNDPTSYRNLSKPVAIQNKSKEQHYINAYNYLKNEFEGASSSDYFIPIAGPYHYGSHYSNSGTVLHFLVRLPPFTQIFLIYQDNNFDIPDRTFHSVNTSWRLSSGDSTSDVKELIPEFFFLPEFLNNNEGFNFGIRQGGERVHHVTLPPWCQNDSRLFVLINRQALESDIVTSQLQNWIDLVFGYKQTGKAAVEAINVFHPVTYYGHDISKIEDPIKRCGLQTMIKTVGQTPRQLFGSPHPMVELSISIGTEQQSTQQVLPNVHGIKWGNYVGSPAALEPVLLWQRDCSVPICTLLPLITNDVFGLANKTCLLLSHRKDNATGILSSTYVMSTALVSWGHKDGIVRMKLQRDRPAIPLLKEHTDPITVCKSVPDCQLLFIGRKSGIIDVYNLKFDSVRSKVEQKSQCVHLYGHSDMVKDIFLCKSYSIAVSISEDCTFIIWDLNRLHYVRSVKDHIIPIELITVSDTLGDIASVSNSDSESYLRVYTINAQAVGTISSSLLITAICYSTAPEGSSVNVIATGHINGTIKLWSSWDLTAVTEIKTIQLQSQIMSIIYSFDNQHLYVSNKEGTVCVWENPNKDAKKSHFLTLM